jgi:hypothetical protein
METTALEAATVIETETAETIVTTTIVTATIVIHQNHFVPSARKMENPKPNIILISSERHLTKTAKSLVLFY